VTFYIYLERERERERESSDVPAGNLVIIIWVFEPVYAFFHATKCAFQVRNRDLIVHGVLAVMNTIFSANSRVERFNI
jgi:hypothetical protein